MNFNIFLRFFVYLIVDIGFKEILLYFDFNSFCFPFIGFIFYMSYELNKYIGLLLVFIFGLILDSFTNTIGVQAFVGIILYITRIRTMRLFYQRDDFEEKYISPNLLNFSNKFIWILGNILVVGIIINILSISSFEVFSFYEYFKSCFLTLIIIYLVEQVVFSKH